MGGSRSAPSLKDEGKEGRRLSAARDRGMNLREEGERGGEGEKGRRKRCRNVGVEGEGIRSKLGLARAQLTSVQHCLILSKSAAATAKKRVETDSKSGEKGAKMTKVVA